MERVGGRYKRMAQQIIFVPGLLLCLALNADAIMIVRELWSDEALRGPIVAAATKKVQSGNPADAGAPNLSFDQVAIEVRRANTPPIGWSSTHGDFRSLPSTANEWLLKILGIALSSFRHRPWRAFLVRRAQQDHQCAAVGQSTEDNELIGAAPLLKKLQAHYDPAYSWKGAQ